MKKLLALVLALVMSMSLVTISNAAFKDADKISNKEAVDVMAAVGVLAGYDNGEFGATDTLTRAQACKIIAYLDLGKDVAEALPAVQVFSDLPANNWAAKYVAYCADAGYVSGVGDNKFAPDEKLTGYQFGKMLLCALGYDATIEEMTGASWTIKVAKLMESNSLTKGTSKLGSAVLTREEAAQYALNALMATCVEYDDKGSTITAGDVTIITGAKKASAKVWGAAIGYKDNVSDAENANGDATVQLGEKLYKEKLVYTASGADNDFSRPAHSWTYDGKTVATAADSAKITFTAKTKAADVAKAMSGIYFDKNTASDVDKVKIADTTITSTALDLTLVTVATSGKTSTTDPTGVTNTAAYIAALTENGKAVEIYTNSSNVITDIVVINYTVAEVTKVVTNAKGDETTYTLKTDAGSTPYKTFTDPDKDDQIVFATAPVKGAIVTVAKISGSLVYVYPTTNFTGAPSAKNASDKVITVNGTKYTVGTGVNDGSDLVAMADFANSSKTTNTYYVDQYGYIVKTTAAAASTDYAYVVGANAKTNTTVDGTTPTLEIRAVLADGTVGVYTVELEKLKTTSSNVVTPTTAANISATLADKDYVVKGTNILVYDDSANDLVADTNLEAWLVETGVFGYTLDGTTMTLETKFETLADGSTTLLADNGTNVIDKNDTSVAAAGGKTILFQNDVAIVVYDDDAKVAKVYTGTASLGATDLDDFRAVVSGKSSSNGIAKIVFATVTGGLTADVSNYVYVKSSDVTVILDGSKTKYQYTGIQPDGSEITLTSTDSFAQSGLYQYASDNTTKNANWIDPSNAQFSARFKTGTMTVSGNLISVDGGTTWYNMENAQTVYVDDNKYEANGNAGIIVLAKDSSGVTKNVETIYVY
mgnify:CR=1 FL=1